MNPVAVQTAGVTEGEEGASVIRGHARCIKRCAPLVDLSVRYLFNLEVTAQSTAVTALAR
jgi:hypothetical protein